MFLWQAAVQVPLEQQVVGVITPISDLGVFVSGVVGAFLTVAGLAALVYLAYGGVRWVMASGDAGKIEEAKQIITNAIIGLGVTACAWAIFLLVSYFLGLNLASGSGGSGSTSAGVGSGAGSAGPGRSGSGAGTAGTRGGSGTTGATSCAGGIPIDQMTNDRGAGGYCNGGEARIRCVGAGQGASGFSYPHYEPVCCVSGTPNPAYTFENPGGGC